VGCDLVHAFRGQTRFLGENDALISVLQELPPRAFLKTEK